MESKIMQSDIQLRMTEIEMLISSDELNHATKRVMDFEADFSVDRKRRKEAIDIRARYNGLREDKRRFGSTEAIMAAFSRLREDILDFIDQIQDERTTLSESKTNNDDLSAKAIKMNTASIRRTQFEDEKELFVEKRGWSSVPSDLVFHGRDIKKRYGNDRMNFTFYIEDLRLRPGEITAVVGENGNGKTTLLRIIAGQLETDEGVIEYPRLVSDVRNNLYFIKQKIAFIPQELPKWSGLAAENLYFSAAIHGISAKKNEEEVDFIISRLGLEQYRNATWSEISGGYKMRFALARALVWNPALLLLDEPLANLDINTQLIFLQDLRHLANSIVNPKSVVISSQNLHSVEEIADNIIFIQNGTALYNGKMKDFGQDREDNAFEFACHLSKEELADILEEISTYDLEEVGYYFILSTPINVSANDLLSLLMKHDVALSYFRDISRSTRKLFKLEK